MTPPNSTLHDIPGGAALFDWFGHVPRFHDAELLEIAFSGKGPGLLRIHAWNMTDQVDAEGYFISDKHATVTLALDGVKAIELVDFDIPAIIFDLQITKVDETYRIEWTSSYGVAGFIAAKQMRASFEPGKPG